MDASSREDASKQGGMRIVPKRPAIRTCASARKQLKPNTAYELWVDGRRGFILKLREDGTLYVDAIMVGTKVEAIKSTVGYHIKINDEFEAKKEV